MQLKLQRDYHFIPSKIVIIEKIDDPEYWRACETKLLLKGDSTNFIYNSWCWLSSSRHNYLLCSGPSAAIH